MNLHNLRDDSDRIGREAAGMRQTASLLQDLADTVSRGKFDTIDVPQQLRRLSSSLSGGAASLQRISELNSQCSWQNNFLLYFRNEIHRLRMQLHHKLRDKQDAERRGWPADYTEKLEEMERLLCLLFEISGDMAADEYCKAAGGGYLAMLGQTAAATEHC